MSAIVSLLQVGVVERRLGGAAVRRIHGAAGSAHGCDAAQNHAAEVGRRRAETQRGTFTDQHEVLNPGLVDAEKKEQIDPITCYVLYLALTYT